MMFLLCLINLLGAAACFGIMKVALSYGQRAKGVFWFCCGSINAISLVFAMVEWWR